MGVHGQEQHVFQPQHVARLQYVADLAISPDGQQIAYLLSVPRKPLEDEDGAAWSELHVVDRANRSRPFVTGKVSVGSPQWMPNGSDILYLAKRNDDKSTAIYRIPIDGGESQRVVSHSVGIADFVVSHDGTRIAFLAKEEMDADEKTLQEKGFNQEIYEEDLRPTKVWLTDITGQEAPRALDLPGSAVNVKWSPSGRELAVALTPQPLIDDVLMFSRIHLVDVDAGRVTQKIDNPGKLGQIGFSPDGKHLAMISAADIHDPMQGRLMVISPAGDRTIRDLMPNYEAHVTSFAWSDAKTLVWVADEGTETRVGSTTLDGATTTLLEPGGTVMLGLSLAVDGPTLGLVGQSPQHPNEVFVLPPGSSEPQRLTQSNAWIDDMRFAKQEVVRWNARDGLELQGVLIYPLNYESGREYPLIMSVHGGPESHEANGWLTSYSRPGQIAAARGFAVFYPNYRGSTGRGVAFSKLGQEDAAGKEFDDLVDGVDHLIRSRLLVDKNRVGITGGSYGGYASAWGSTYYSDRYAASVMFVGISDNVSKVGHDRHSRRDVPGAPSQTLMG